MAITLEIDIDLTEVDELLRQYPREIEAALNDIIDELIGKVEQTQILKYTADAFPAQPPGSDYERTFTLQRASKKRKTRTALPRIEAEWFVDEVTADYGDVVLGETEDQAPIHRGRWKSLEEVAREVERQAPDVIEVRLGEINL